jgi:hypothetical protein
MNFGWDEIGGQIVLRRTKISATFATAGIYATTTADGGAGIVVGLRTTVASQVGVTIDTGTYSTTQGDAEGRVTLIRNPYGVYRMLMVGDELDAQLTITTNATVDTGGTVVTITSGNAAPNSPSMDEGTIVCVEGANLGQTRKITSVAATTATVTVPFLNDIAVNDVFITVPWAVDDVAGDNVNLGRTLTNAEQDVAVGTGADFRPLVLEFDISSQANARQKSYVYANLVSHVLTQGT